jgi:hypothetical protein
MPQEELALTIVEGVGYLLAVYGRLVAEKKLK